jgi:putative ABC transport system substrate-binding protein
LISVAGISIVAMPALGQQAARVWRIGFLGLTGPDAPVSVARLEAFRAGLRELGYVEGKNIAIDLRWAGGDFERLPVLAAELVALKVDVLVTYSTPGAFAAKRATHTTPVVLASVGDPVSTGVVASLARPGGNLTGSSIFAADETVKRLELLRDALPHSRRVAVLVNPSNPLWRSVIKAIERVAEPRKLEIRLVEVRTSADFDGAFAAMAEKRPDALVVVEDPLFTGQARRLAELATKHGLPSIGAPTFAQAGGLIGNGANQLDLFRRAAVFVDKIIRGAKPEELPIEQATRFELVVNLKTAKALGITLPRAFLFRADMVIE